MMNQWNRVLPIGVLVCIAVYVSAFADDAPFEAPPGFEVTRYADDSLAHDIYSMTIDEKGRVVVAGRQYVKILHDTDADGMADKATLFSDRPRSGAHGLLFDGPHLIATGDDSVMVLRDDDGDDRADGEPQSWARLRHPEHGANGLTWGPDGWVYLICGNDSGLSASHATLPGSPVREPTMGGVVRFTPDGKGSQVVAHGFRNPYDLAFDGDGRLWTVDADGERDHHLPWYAPNRLFDIAQGRHHGWMIHGWQLSWNRPAYFFDNVERASEIGRGSPTGVTVYRHHVFPPRYRGVFSLCWTLGSVYHFAESGAEVFVQTRGASGFAPVDIEVGPAGDMFVAVGGRGTAGGVFRIRYIGGESFEADAPGASPLSQVLRAPQPMSSWSRARWRPIAQRLGAGEFERCALDQALSDGERVRAVEVLVDVFGGVSTDSARRAFAQGDGAVAARAAWAISRRTMTDDDVRLLARMTHSDDAVVKLAAWQALATLSQCTNELAAEADWLGTWASEHRRIRAAAAMFVANLLAGNDSPAADQSVFTRHANGLTPRQRLAYHAGRPQDAVNFDPQAKATFIRGLLSIASRAISPMDARTHDPIAALDAVRLCQIALGDIRTHGGERELDTGYSALRPLDMTVQMRNELVESLSDLMTGRYADFDREVARLAAMLRPDDARRFVERLAMCLTDETDPVDDIHYLMAMGQLPGLRSRSTTHRVARAFAMLHGKMRDRRYHPSRNWPMRVSETFAANAQHDFRLAQALLDDPAFGEPDHAMFAQRMPAALQPAAARRLFDTAMRPAYADQWSSDLVRVVSMLDDDSVTDALRAKWSQYALRDAIALRLASRPDAVDHDRLIEALGSTQANVSAVAAGALLTIPPRLRADDARPAGWAMRQAAVALTIHAKNKATFDALLRLLAHQASAAEAAETPPLTVGADPVKAADAWARWLAAAFPGAAVRPGFAGADFNDRLKSIDWAKGAAARGAAVYQARACQACHSATDRLGPSLKGAAQRFTVADLFAAIIDPAAEVSPLYRVNRYVMRDGGELYGVSVYESPDGTLVQTGPGVTVRITTDQYLRVEPSDRSLMPPGLLQGLSDGELADLYAYLKGIDR